MSIKQSAALAMVLALSTSQAIAQQQADADTDGDMFVSSDEASAHSEQRFAKIAEGGAEFTLAQFQAAMIGPEMVGAEANTSWHPETEFNEADLDQNGSLNRDEWMTWRAMRFAQAAGTEGQVEAGLYKSIDSGGTVPDNEGGTVAPIDPPAN